MVDERQVRQVATMADARMVELLTALLTAPAGVRTLAELEEPNVAGAGAPVARRDDLTARLGALVDAGLVEHVPGADLPRYRATADAWVRFGSLVPEVVPPAAGVHAAVLARETARLAAQLEGVFAPGTVARYVHESYDLLASRARVQAYLPVLATRFAADRLHALARAERGGAGRPEVLFVCVRNAGRSQLAAAALRHHAGDRVGVRTAGSAPAARVDPAVRAVLAERGWWDVREFPKPLTDEVVRGADWVVSLGCGDACPVHPGRHYLDWSVPDPAGHPVEHVRAVLAQVEEHVTALLTRIDAG